MNLPESSHYDALIVRVLSGDFTSEDVERLVAWCAESAENKAYFERMKTIWQAVPEIEITAIETEDSLRAIKRRAKKRHSSFRRRSLWAGLCAAAVVAVVLVARRMPGPEVQDLPAVTELTAREVPVPAVEGGITITLADGSVHDVMAGKDRLAGEAGLSDIDAESVVYTEKESEPAGKETAYNTVSVGPGKRYRVELADGSVVWLNSGSSLTYPVNFTGPKREVAMSGECYFEVAPDAGKPFTVAAPEMEITVLGTAFNVGAYRGEVVSMTLASGKVRVTAGEDTLGASPGTRIEYDPTHGALSTGRVNPADFTGWKDGILRFTNLPLDRAVAKMELWFGIRIENRSGIPGNLLFSGEFDNADARSAVRSLAVNAGTEFVYDGLNGIYILGKAPGE